MGRSDQLPVGRDIGPEVTGIKERRGADPYVDAFGACFFQHMDQIRHGSAPDNGIIHQDDPLSFYRGFQHAEFHPHAVFPLFLCGLDEGSSHIAVFVESKSKGNPGCRGVL